MNGAALAALLSSGTWAVGISVYARLARHHSGSKVNATRALVATPLFALYLLIESRGLTGSAAAIAAIGPARLGFLVLSVLTSFALGDVLFLRSANALGVPAAMSIASAYPLWAALGGVLFRHETLMPRRLGGVLAVVAGTVLVIVSSGSASDADGDPRLRTGRLAGVLLALATSLFWAVNSVAVGLGSQGVPLGAAGFCRMTFALVLCPLLGLLLPRGGAAGQGGLFVPRAHVRPVLGVFVLESFGGAWLFTYGLTNAPLAVGAALSSLAPVLAVPIALWTGAERFSAAKSLGIVMVIGGVFLLVS